MITEDQKKQLAKLSKRSGLSVDQITALIVSKYLIKIFPKEYKTLNLKVKPNKYLGKAAKALKVSKGDVIATLITSYILRLEAEKANEKINSRK